MRTSTLLARAAVLVGLLVLSLAATTAQASTIHACVNKHSGAARIVSSKAKCRKNERRASWSTVGPAGPSGTSGAPGAPGANGVGVDYGNVSFGPDPLPLQRIG